MTGSTSVSVLVPLADFAPFPDAVRQTIERYLESTGFTFQMIAAEASTYGAAIRRGAAEATGSVMVIIDPRWPYPVSAIGAAVAMISSGSTDVVFGRVEGRSADRPPLLLRWMLVEELPDPLLPLMAFSSSAAGLVISETRLDRESSALEIAYLINKYGLRVERLSIESGSEVRPGPSFSLTSSLVAALRIRLNDRRMSYRAARRCPVCFSSEVWTVAQVPGNVIRACSRCKCRYLNQFSEEDETHPVHRPLRPHLPLTGGEESHSESARARTGQRRLSVLRRHLPARASVLEIGVHDGSFGMAAAREFTYVGIDSAPIAVRQARARGLDVYCATLSTFVNTGPAFDAIASFHVFENVADPHDALSRIKDLIKPGGILFLTTFDTEGLIYLLSERRNLARTFRTRLILYSRSALIELLEHSGFEIAGIGPDFEYRDHKFLRHWLSNRWRRLARVVEPLLAILPDPLLVSSGSIRIVARRRAGAPLIVRTIRSVEPTHAR